MVGLIVDDLAPERVARNSIGYGSAADDLSRRPNAHRVPPVHFQPGDDGNGLFVRDDPMGTVVGAHEIDQRRQLVPLVARKIGQIVGPIWHSSKMIL